MKQPIRQPLLALAAALAVLSVAVADAAMAQTATPTKPAPKAAKKPVPAKKAPAETAPPAASAEQVEAAERVYYGLYDCEANQKLDVVANAKYPSYVDIKLGKIDYLTKPVLSSTGAIRLEDVRGVALMVQIANKSMLLNVKTGQRIVDDCISPKQRELIEAAKTAKAAQEAASAPAK